MAKTQGIKFICDLCGELIEIGRPRFVLKGELYCAYDGGVFEEMTLTPPEKIGSEMRRLIALMEQKSEKELNDEVHYPFQLDLCRKCRDRFYDLIDSRH